jgi:hypothetical protein
MAYCTVAQVKQYAGIGESTDDALLDSLVVRAKGIIDAFTHTTFDASTTASHYFTLGVDTEGPYMLWLDDYCAGITQVLNGDASSTEITSSQYTTIPKNTTPYYGIKILRSASKVWEFTDDPEDAITVTGYWGYSTAAPSDIVHAAVRLTTFLYRQKDTSMDLDRPILTDAGVTLLPAGVPKDVVQLLISYRDRR